MKKKIHTISNLSAFSPSQTSKKNKNNLVNNQKYARSELFSNRLQPQHCSLHTHHYTCVDAEESHSHRQLDKTTASCVPLVD